MPARSDFEMYHPCDEERIFDISLEEFNILNCEIYRSPFYRDYGRLVHSPAFRRLQGKSQLFPSNESDFFRNRLTHSIEVAQIAKAIANRLNWILSDKPKHRRDIVNYIDTDLVQFAGLAHDLGHPPFGHQGEAELNYIMRDHGGFEGNAQTLRILTKIEKKVKWDSTNKNQDHAYGFSKNGADERYGLNVTVRALASILKYDKEIEVSNTNGKENRAAHHDRNHPLTKGYYNSERNIVDEVKRRVSRGKEVAAFKTVEMQIMEIADDIAYSVYDLEDSLKGGFITGLDLVTDLDSVFDNVSIKVSQTLKRNVSQHEVRRIVKSIFKEFVKKVDLSDLSVEALSENFKSGELQSVVTSFAYANSRNQAKNGYYRTQFTSLLIGKFVRSVNIDLNEENPAFSEVKIDNDSKIYGYTDAQTALTIEVLKRFTYEFQIQSHKLRIVESRGRDIVRTIFDKILKSKGAFMPEDYRNIYYRISKIPNEHEREILQHRTICDFVASMTDKYAVEFYGRLTSENPQSIFVNI